MTGIGMLTAYKSNLSAKGEKEWNNVVVHEAP
jgi:hypothetical protein